MLTRAEFNRFEIGADPYRNVSGTTYLGDLQPKDESLPIQLSVLMSTYHRYSQLRRSLECLSRQNWKNFEVIICDDGDDYDLSPIYAEFDPYLRIKHHRRDRLQFHVDPTGGFRSILPMAEGEVIALMQPELMLHPEACHTLYLGHFEDIPDGLRCPISRREDGYEGKWISLKVLFMSPRTQPKIDTVDWHSNIHNIQQIAEFWEENCGLGGKTNREWASWPENPWWFIASGLRDDPIFDLPEFLGHASIDFYLIGYRNKHNYLDIMPYRILAYHQDHHRFSVGFEGEQEEVKLAVERTLEK